MMRKNLTTEGNHISQLEVGNNNHHNKSMFVFFISAIALGLVSLSLLATIANAQTPSNSTSGAKSTTSNESGVKQMGICVVGAGGPCNGDTSSAK
jgi:hypothetical protein